MSLTADALGLVVAAAVASGTAIQASQAFAELNAETPLTNALAPLFLASFRALFSVVLSKTDVAVKDERLRSLGLGQVQQDGHVVELTEEQVKCLKKWVGWFWGWFLINLGAIVALVVAIVAVVHDIWH
jgi:hypothetical protein